MKSLNTHWYNNSDIASLTVSHDKIQRIAYRIGNSMNFSRKPFSSAPGLLLAQKTVCAPAAQHVHGNRAINQNLCSRDTSCSLRAEISRLHACTSVRRFKKLNAICPMIMTTNATTRHCVKSTTLHSKTTTCLNDPGINSLLGQQALVKKSSLFIG